MTTTPERFRTVVGELPAAGALPDAGRSPYETAQPARDGFVERDGVKVWWAVWGDAGPWLAFAPPFQIVHSQFLKACVPYLSHHFRVVTCDGRGNGRSDRPDDPAAYAFDHYVADFAAVLDAAGADPVALVGISLGSLTVLRLAAEQPQRVSHLVIAGGYASTVTAPEMVEAERTASRQMRDDWPG